MTKEEILQILPHRDDMLLLDEVSMDGSDAVGHYRVRGDEFFLRGHFPGNPIVPGVILCEILAQSACVLMKDAMAEGKLPVYTGLSTPSILRRAPCPWRAGSASARNSPSLSWECNLCFLKSS